METHFTKAVALFACLVSFNQAVAEHATPTRPSPATGGRAVVPAAILTIGDAMVLPECGGTVQIINTGGQVSLVFKGVSKCSNFDIISKSGAFEAVDYKAKKIPGPDGNRAGSFSIPEKFIKAGLNDIRIVVKSNSGAHTQLIDVVFNKNPFNPNSLLGRCNPDPGLVNFQLAKGFASSPFGLNLRDADATKFALDYNATHKCGTINEFNLRYSALQGFASSPFGLSMNGADSRKYALERAEHMTAKETTAMNLQFSAANGFFSSPFGLNLPGATARANAQAWAERGCGDAIAVAKLQTEYSRLYGHASSPFGLSLPTARAKTWALDGVRPLTPCGDLLK